MSITRFRVKFYNCFYYIFKIIIISIQVHVEFSRNTFCKLIKIFSITCVARCFIHIFSFACSEVTNIHHLGFQDTYSDGSKCNFNFYYCFYLFFFNIYILPEERSSAIEDSSRLNKPSSSILPTTCSAILKLLFTVTVNSTGPNRFLACFYF